MTLKSKIKQLTRRLSRRKKARTREGKVLPSYVKRLEYQTKVRLIENPAEVQAKIDEIELRKVGLKRIVEKLRKEIERIENESLPRCDVEMGWYLRLLYHPAEVQLEAKHKLEECERQEKIQQALQGLRDAKEVLEELGNC